MAQFPLTKRDKMEIINLFLGQLKEKGLVVAEEVEDEETGKVTLSKVRIEVKDYVW